MTGKKTTGHVLPGFLEIITRLRGEDGCPWDRKQTPATIKKYLLEETAELTQAIDEGDPTHICEEIGDVFYILAMLCAMFEERGEFNADDALRAISEKMIRRHPHVFAGRPTGDDKALKQQWEAIKQRERRQ
ncbi:MAG TPA: nucleotide pyrophosphohydrolase [Desulfobulbus sp.]|nr:nucleotide pyrophosphohydrolase [Desulfobulbus sp.]